MERKRKLILNTISSLLQQIVTIICGFILPRYMLGCYGSEVNGLVSSITQFLGFISILQLGVGAVIQSAWYKPLAENDIQTISEIFISAQRFFRRIAIVFTGYIVVLCILYPLKVQASFDYPFTVCLILAISISLFVQYYFGITNQLLLYADQRAYLYLFIQTILVIINTIVSVVLMKVGTSIQVVKLGASIIYAINPILLSIIVRNRYKIKYNIKLNEEPIKQKWNGFAQHLASVVMDNTDVMILTIFSTLSNVSIYYVYHLVVYGIRQLINSLTVGAQSMFGNMIALNEKSEINKSFSRVEILFHFVITLLFSCAMALILPFIQIYTQNVSDANYNVPVFAIIITVAFAIYCYRLPYYSIIKAAGHFKETQVSAFIEMTINIVVSIITVINYGLVGVAIGTLVANLYRTLYFVVYLGKHIINSNSFYFIRLLILDTLAYILTYVATKNLMLTDVSYWGWIILATKVFMVCLIVTLSLMGIGNIDIIISNLKRKNTEEI